MRRVQAQRRILEEQHASCPPVKASPSIVVGAPGTVSKKAAKTPKPAPPKVPEVVSSVPEAIPIAVPMVEAPKIIPPVEPPKEEPVAKLVEVEVVAEPEPEPEVVVQEVEIQEVPAPVITEEPVIEVPPVEAAPVEEAPVEAAPVEVAVTQEVEEIIIPEAEPETEVILPAEAPATTPADIEVVPEETAVITEAEQTHDVCEPEPTAFTEVVSVAVEEPITEETEDGIVETEVIEELTVDATKPEVEDIEEVAVEEPKSFEPEPTEVTEAIPIAVEDVEADMEDVASQSEDSESVDSGPVEPESVEQEPIEEITVAVTQEVMVTETVQCMESDPMAEEEEEESGSSQEEEEEDCEMEVLSEEAPEETNHIIEDIPIPNEELPVEQDALPLPPLTAAPEPVTQVEEVSVNTADIMVDDFVVTDTSAEVIEPKTIELLPVFEKPTVAVCEIFGSGPVKMTSEPELIPAAEDTLNDVAADKSFDEEEPLPEPCQIPLDQESVTNTSINMLIGTEWMAQQPIPGLDC